MKISLLLMLTAIAVPAHADTYIRGGVGAVVDRSHTRDFEGSCSRPNPKTGACNTFTRRIESDRQSLAFEGAIGHQFNPHFRMEVHGSYEQPAADKAGCISCKPPIAGNGFSYSPEKQVGHITMWTGMINAIGDMPLGKKVVASVGVGGGVLAIRPHTSYPDKKGWRLENSTMNPAAQLLAELRYHVGDRVDVGVNYAFVTTLNRVREDFMSNGYVRLASGSQHEHFHRTTVGITLHFGHRDQPEPPLLFIPAQQLESIPPSPVVESQSPTPQPPVTPTPVDPTENYESLGERG